jgi:hypothetical protein
VIWHAIAVICLLIFLGAVSEVVNNTKKGLPAFTSQNIGALFVALAMSYFAIPNSFERLITGGGFVSAAARDEAQAHGLETAEQMEVKRKLDAALQQRADQIKQRDEALLKDKADTERLEAEVRAKMEQLAKARECDENPKCLTDNDAAEASVLCQISVEKSAKFDFEWVDSWLGTKFPLMQRNGKIIKVGGDKIKLQNGFGAWGIHTYVCTYDRTTKRLTGISVQPGRL